MKYNMGFIENVVFGLFFLYGKASTHIQDFAKWQYTYNPVVQVLVEFYRAIAYKHRRIENSADFWVTSFHLKSITGKYELVEFSYDILVDCSSIFEFFKIAHGCVSQEFSPLVVMKTDNSYFFRVTNPDLETDVERSEIRFLTVEYRHPTLIGSIFLNIPKNWFMVGNELFSSAFVLRALELQAETFVFDLEYTLLIVDQDIVSSILKSSDYVRIEKTKYEIIHSQ